MQHSIPCGSRPQLSPVASPAALQPGAQRDPLDVSQPPVNLAELDVFAVSDADALVSMFDSMMERAVVLASEPSQPAE